jgi:hypothetical protein
MKSLKGNGGKKHPVAKKHKGESRFSIRAFPRNALKIND